MPDSVTSAYFTARQIAELLQVDEKTILKWSLTDSTMPVLRIGRVVRFPQAPLMLWLARRASPRRAHGGRIAPPLPPKPAD